MRVAILFPCLVLLLTPALAADTLRVDHDGSGDYTDIQSAIDAAADGDTVLVGPGEYVIDEPIDFNRLHDPEDPASPLLRNITLRSKEGAGATTIRMAEFPVAPCGTASVVVFRSQEDASSVLEGFLLTGGRGMLAVCNARDQAHGGGISVWDSGPTIRDCVVAENSADLGGGVFCGDKAHPTIVDCTIQGNAASGDPDIDEAFGGGVFCEAFNGSATLTLISCLIQGNSASTGGGLYFGRGASGTVTDCKISENSAEELGGGVYAEANGGASPLLEGCHITGNSARSGGGVFYGGFPQLYDCTILNNRATEHGGGVCCSEGDCVVTNCIVAGNVSEWGGGLALIDGGSVTLGNCTIEGNKASTGGGLYCNDKSGSMTNCILWNNSGGLMEHLCHVAVTYSCVQGEDVRPGDGNINQDPLYAMQGQWESNGTPDDSSDDLWIEGDYHLQPDSPCIDSGTLDGASAFDIEGAARPCGTGVDMGAYESGDCAPSQFRRGYINEGADLDIADPIFALNYLFGGGPAPSCLQTADVNDTGGVDLTDAVYLLSFLFLGGPPPELPFSSCGRDPTMDSLTCGSFQGCE